MTGLMLSDAGTDMAEIPRHTETENMPIQREDVLIAALACGASVTEAARRSAMSPRTVHRRLDDPAFRSEIHKARSRMVDGALGRLTETLGEAAQTLRDLLKSKKDSVRLNAARVCFDIALKLQEKTTFEERLAALEQQYANDQYAP